MPDYQTCPTCGSTLAVVSSDEGTQGFVPVDARQLAARDAEPGQGVERVRLLEKLASIVREVPWLQGIKPGCQCGSRSCQIATIITALTTSGKGEAVQA